MVYTITQHMQIPLTTITSTILLLMPGLMFNCMFTINLQIITLLTHIIHIHLVSLIMMDMAIISTIKLMATTSILFIQQRVMEVEVEQSQQLLYFFVAVALSWYYAVKDIVNAQRELAITAVIVANE